jgi:hypothetical protein
MKRRIAIGLLLLLHGLAHASVGVWAAYAGPLWLVTVLWTVAMIGYLGASVGVLRAPILRDQWKAYASTATVASIVMLLFYGGWLSIFGIMVDTIVLIVALGWAQPRIDAAVAVVDNVGAAGLPHPMLHRIAWGGALVFLGYATVVALMRPVYLRWGTTAAEREMRLPGDDMVRFARYRVDHAITIHAPADSVWPWLVQMGQDRGGFYSYARLERLVGDRIRNADRVHPEWQTLAEGDLVRAVQPSYLGGIFGDSVGWRVAAIEPGRAIVLKGWGAFVLVPVDPETTRLIVRTRGEAAPSLLGLVLGPINVFVFEPAHFIMQRGMLRGIRARAERASVITAER